MAGSPILRVGSFNEAAAVMPPVSIGPALGLGSLVDGRPAPAMTSGSWNLLPDRTGALQEKGACMREIWPVLLKVLALLLEIVAKVLDLL